MSFDLCIVGAGIAGVSALNAATTYLPRGARVVVDREASCGGCRGAGSREQRALGHGWTRRGRRALLLLGAS